MNDTDRKEESWVRKLPKVIFALAVLIFIIIIFSNHNQFIKWKKNQAELSGKVQQTSEELALLREANGSLQQVTENGQRRRRTPAMAAGVTKRRWEVEEILRMPLVPEAG